MTQTIEHLHSQLASLQSSLSLRSSGDELILKVTELESENCTLREEVHQQSSLIRELDEDAGRLALEGEESASVIQNLREENMALKENLFATLQNQLAKSENEAIILKHDLQQSARRESELREIINDLRSTMDGMASGKKTPPPPPSPPPQPVDSSAAASKIESLEAANRKLGNL
ncbi:hypothetical protein TrRE_jg7116, partial [Triparma retinervis]